MTSGVINVDLFAVATLRLAQLLSRSGEYGIDTERAQRATALSRGETLQLLESFERQSLAQRTLGRSGGTQWAATTALVRMVRA